jgi:FO synthase subunit 2
MSASLGALLDGIDAGVRATLAACLDGRELAWQDALALCEVRGAELQALTATADALRSRQAGDIVTYVVNRNVNFTNVCVKTCRFCAFSRDHRSEQGYFLDLEEVVRRATQAYELGATEVCLQAGLAPGVDGRFYIELCRALKRALPDLHLHAFSPEEVKYGARLLGVSIREFLGELKAAGLGSLPGTSAEVLDDAVRDRIAPGRITTQEWLNVIRTAHGLGIPTTSTLMFGHVESHAERLRHLDLLRSVQRETGGFTEFVPLSFVHHEAPMFARSLIPSLRAGPTGNDVIRLFSISRLMLGETFRNIQVSWVKEGLRQAQWLLSCGANDLGGTLMNESISTAAGARHGQLVTPSALRSLIRAAGREPAQRDTRYHLLRRYGVEPDTVADPLDGVADPDATFGSYAKLAASSDFRFELRRRHERDPSAPVRRAKARSGGEGF